jgi:hypothetical protein
VTGRGRTRLSEYFAYKLLHTYQPSLGNHKISQRHVQGVLFASCGRHQLQRFTGDVPQSCEDAGSEMAIQPEDTRWVPDKTSLELSTTVLFHKGSLADAWATAHKVHLQAETPPDTARCTHTRMNNMMRECAVFEHTKQPTSHKLCP